jgi:hypothetical protein
MGSKWARTLTGICVVVSMGLVTSAAMALEADPEGWIAFDGSEGQIGLDGSVNGEPVRIIIDSTVNTSVISSAFAERAGIRKDHKVEFEMGGSLANKRVYASRRFEVEIDGSSLNFSGLPIVPGDGFDMILGHPVFEGAVVQIDYPNQRFRFLSPEAVKFEGNTEVRRGPLGELMVETAIEGNRAWLTLDTGLPGATLLTEDFVISNGLDDKRIETTQETGSEQSEADSLQMLKLDRVELGPYRFEQFLARYGGDEKRTMDVGRGETGSRIRKDRSHHDGLLGYEVLKNFLITADFSNSKLHLQVP